MGSTNSSLSLVQLLWPSKVSGRNGRFSFVKVIFQKNFQKLQLLTTCTNFPQNSFWSKFRRALTKLVFLIFDFFKFRDNLGPFWTFFRVFPIFGPKLGQKSPDFSKTQNSKTQDFIWILRKICEDGKQLKDFRKLLLHKKICNFGQFWARSGQLWTDTETFC